MAKKNRFYDYDDDEELVLDKKTKRRLERAKSRNNVQQPPQEEEEEAVPSDPSSEALSRIAVLCQENRWREAVLFCRETLATAEADGNDDVAVTMSMALGKLEMSLRRQIAAAVLSKAQDLLTKEYGLNVGQQ